MHGVISADALNLIPPPIMAAPQVSGNFMNVISSSVPNVGSLGTASTSMTGYNKGNMAAMVAAIARLARIKMERTEDFMAAAPIGARTSRKRSPAMKNRLSVLLLHVMLGLGLGLSGCAGAGPNPAPRRPNMPRRRRKSPPPRPWRGWSRAMPASSPAAPSTARQTPDRRRELAAGQHPFAVILGCADSRTGPEILFDQGLGDLFVVRVAGNVLDDHAIGSIEYGVEHLHAPLIVVLGHSRCCAVAAARDVVAGKGRAEGHIESLVAAIRPAVEATVGQDLDATCKANVRNAVHALRTSEPVLRHMAEKGEIKVVGAYYDLDTGVVAFLPD